MLGLWQATLASMFAPGLALRGPPGSMDLAVTQLVEEYQGAMRLFVLSLFLFMLTALLWCARLGRAQRVRARLREHDCASTTAQARLQLVTRDPPPFLLPVSSTLSTGRGRGTRGT